MAIDERTLPLFISTHKPFTIFSLSCPVVEGTDRMALVGTWHPARANLPHRLNYFCSKISHNNSLIKLSIKYFNAVLMTVMKNILIGSYFEEVQKWTKKSDITNCTY